MNNDLEILKQIRTANNSKTISALYQHLPAIRRMIRYHGGNRQQAEDVFQDALIILCRKAEDESFTLSAGVYPYLYSVCRFLWNDELKKMKRAPISELDPDTSDVLQSDIGTAIEEETRYKMAERIIAELGDRCKELLLLFYHTKMKLREIAEKMGYNSEQTAKNQKYKCIEGARDKYREAQKQLSIR